MVHVPALSMSMNMNVNMNMFIIMIMKMDMDMDTDTVRDRDGECAQMPGINSGFGQLLNSGCCGTMSMLKRRLLECDLLQWKEEKITYKYFNAWVDDKKI
jgi:hypothetical protein